MTAAAGFTIPNASAVAYPAMARVFSTDLQVLEAAEEQTYVITGCALTAGSGYNANLSAGRAKTGLYDFGVAAVTNQTLGAAADSTNPKWILAELTPGSGATLVFTHGTAASSPLPPDTTSGRVTVGFIYVPASATTGEAWQGNADGKFQIIDKRVLRGHVLRRSQMVGALQGAALA